MKVGDVFMQGKIAFCQSENAYKWTGDWKYSTPEVLARNPFRWSWNTFSYMYPAENPVPRKVPLPCDEKKTQSTKGKISQLSNVSEWTGLFTVTEGASYATKNTNENITIKFEPCVQKFWKMIYGHGKNEYGSFALVGVVSELTGESFLNFAVCGLLSYNAF